MANGLSTFGSSQALPPLFGPISKPTSFLPPISFLCRRRLPISRRKHLTICFVLEERELLTTPFQQSLTPLTDNDSTSTSTSTSGNNDDDDDDTVVTRLSTLNDDRQITAAHLSDKLARKKSERFTYLVAAVMSSLGISSMAIMAVYYRFYWQMEGRAIPVTEMLGTFALSVGAAVGMEFWARWAHKALWHASLWHMHESHHKPREGPFELNDVFAIINAVPAIALLSYGFFHKGLVPGLCFGAGLGITVFGIAYMFVHDGLVHKRFSVGPIADVPYFRRVAAAHQLHHSEKFDGVPYGLFMGPKELEEVGGLEELEKEINRRIKLSKGSN